MRFQTLCDLFEKLESTSKRLEKIMILRDFLEQNPKESPLIFDMISGSYQREINKKTIGISLKTIFSVLSSVSKSSQTVIEKHFNKVGDLGKVAMHFLEEGKRTSLQSKELELQDITKAFTTIGNTKGTNSNKIKKEILSNLFFQAKSNSEYKFLARMLIDDYRIGVSEGVLKEASVNALFPKIKGIHKQCQNCQYISLNAEKCFNCKEPLEKKEDFTKLKEIEADIENSLKIKRSEVIVNENPREIYNFFLASFEKKYNLLNSFRLILKELQEDLAKVLDAKIILGMPIKSMLGTRTKNIEEAIDMTGLPSLADFKYDGLRIQIHNDKGKIRLFSRNLEEITKQFPEIIEFIETNFKDLSFVMDSECVGFDFEKEKFLPFQVLSRRIMTKDVRSVSHIKVVIKSFDLLYLNGKTLIDEPYEKRRKEMDSLFLNRPLRQKKSFDIEKLKKAIQQ